MKKFLSVLLSLSMILGIFSFPVFAFDNNTKKPVNNIQRALDKAQADLNKANSDKVKLEAVIQKAIAKANNPVPTKAPLNPTALKEKWQEELDKAAANDKIELDNLNNDITKWTQAYNSQQTNLNKQFTDIGATLSKQLAALDVKISTADAATKLTLGTAKTNLSSYATARQNAITTYLTALQSILLDKQKIWDERKALLAKRQIMDNAFRTAMIGVKNNELNDKLTALAQATPTPVNNETSIRAKYKDQTDLIQIRINNLNSLITDLKSKLPN